MSEFPQPNKNPDLNADPVSASAPAAGTDKMGERFIQAGLLDKEQVARVVQLQNAEQIRFGEAAVRLGLLTERDIQAVLSQQFNYATATASANIDISLDIAHMPYSLESEAIRQIRAELSIRLSGQPKIALALVSANDREGKSYLSASLSLAFAQMGKRTLLIDANLRHPSQHALFGLPRKTGLSTVLAGRSAIDENLLSSGFPNLTVLTAGPTPPNPLEILLEPALTDLIAGLSDRYDVFIVDTPNTGLSSDAQTISRQVGACLLVARKDVTSIADLHQMQAQMKTAGAQIIGTVYNEFSEPAASTVTSRVWDRVRSWRARKSA